MEISILAFVFDTVETLVGMDGGVRRYLRRSTSPTKLLFDRRKKFPCG
jgi:hypothetical protein